MSYKCRICGKVFEDNAKAKEDILQELLDHEQLCLEKQKSQKEEKTRADAIQAFRKDISIFKETRKDFIEQREMIYQKYKDANIGEEFLREQESFNIPSIHFKRQSSSSVKNFKPGDKESFDYLTSLFFGNH